MSVVNDVNRALEQLRQEWINDAVQGYLEHGEPVKAAGPPSYVSSGVRNPRYRVRRYQVSTTLRSGQMLRVRVGDSFVAKLPEAVYDAMKSQCLAIQSPDGELTRSTDAGSTHRVNPYEAVFVIDLSSVDPKQSWSLVLVSQ
jgi:hypothetical protein